MLLPFIEKVLRVSLSLNKGQIEEIKFSKRIHRHGIPVLASPLLLREMGLGQIDLCRLVNDRVEVFEVKSSGRLSSRQRLRILRSASFLSHLFDKMPCVKVLSGNM